MFLDLKAYNVMRLEYVIAALDILERNVTVVRIISIGKVPSVKVIPRRFVFLYSMVDFIE